MDVNAIVQATQTQQSAAPQDSGNSSAADLFSYLLKHTFGNSLSGHTLLNASSVLDMVGSAPAYVPPQVTAPPPAPTNTNTTQTQNNNQNGASNTANQSGPAATVTATNSNGGGNQGSQAQTNGNSSQGQQNGTQSNNSNATTTQTTTTAPTATTQTVTGEDQATEETAAVMAAAAYIVQQVQTHATAVEAVAQVTSSAANTAGPQQQATGPSTAQTVGPNIRAIDQAQAAEETPDETPDWSANFLNSAPATPEIAQQASSLAQITGQSGAKISVQTTSGDSVAASNTSALAPDAVLAIPGFFTGGQQGSSTGSGTGDQSNAQQGNGQSDQDATVDPAALMLAQEIQVMSAMSALLQSGSQGLVAMQQQGGAASVAAAAGATSAAEAAMPQPSQVPSGTAQPSNFVAQLQEADETQQPQAAKPILLPSAVDQIKMQIEKGLQQGSTTIKVQLTPENMGRVEVKLDVQNGTVKATITADRPDTLAALKSDQSGMLQALTDAGLNADSNSLSFYLRGDQQQQQRQFAQAGRQGRNGANGTADDDALAGLSGIAGATSTTGANGALDISV